MLCQKKKRKETRVGLVFKPIISCELNDRGQVDLINYESFKDGEYCYVMHYQDHLTKYSWLRALKSKTAAEVAYNLYLIFVDFGAPKILQSDNGREFVAEIIKSMKILYPDMLIVHGSPRHPQSQGSNERGNYEIKKILSC